MTRLSYIGDPLPALAFSLLGARCYSPALSVDDVAGAFTEALQAGELVVIETAYAALVREHIEARLAANPAPPVLVVPPLHGDVALGESTVRAARRVLGVS